MLFTSRKVAVFATLSCVLLLVSCASVTEHAQPVYAAPTAEEGVVYFFRENRFAGGGISFYVYEGEKKIGGLTSGSYFFHRAKPGKHTYKTTLEQGSLVTVDVKANETYYVKAHMLMGAMVWYPTLLEIPVSEGATNVRGLKYVTTQP